MGISILYVHRLFNSDGKIRDVSMEGIQAMERKMETTCLKVNWKKNGKRRYYHPSIESGRWACGCCGKGVEVNYTYCVWGAINGAMTVKYKW